jgi:DNA-binding NarL/FixJ family response regulator
MNHPINQPESMKSCCRCGAQFHTSDSERVCWRCRKPNNASPRPRRKELTFREAQIVELVAQGKANKEIAFQLLLSEGTIKEYLNRIFRKLEVPNRTALAIWEFTRRAATASSPFEGGSAFEKRPLPV